MSQESPSSSKETILIVDDTPANLTLLTRMLSKQGYNVQIASSGKLALKSVQSAPPDLILLDIIMPQMDGYAVCETLKADEQTRDIPIIFISASNEVFDKVKAFASGGVDYISKPFQLEEVLARVENQLRLRRLSQKLAEENARLLHEIREKEAAARERQQIEETLQQNAIKLSQHNQVLTELARNNALNEGNLEAALREITEATARNIAVERVSVWLFDTIRTKIQCLDLFELSLNQHSQGLELLTADYPAYFKALTQESVIVADDAHTDPRTREFVTSYLTPLGITAMLDAPITLGEQAVGVLCCEHVGTTRQWMPEDQNFARSAADLVSLALQARERKRADSASVAARNAAVRSAVALRESEEKFSKAFRSSPDAITLTTLTNGRFIEVNDSFCGLFGYSREEVIGCTVVELNIWDNPADVVRLRELLHQQGVVRNVEIDFRTKSGELRTGLLSAEIVDIGFEPCVLSISKDITDRKRTTEALRNSEKRYRELFEGSVDGIVWVDLEGRFIDCNFTYQKMLGYSLEELRQKKFPEITPQKWHDREAEIINKQVLERGYSDTYQKEYIRKDGTVFPVELTVYCQKNDAGQPETTWAIVRDISDRKLTEAALTESEKKYRNLVEASQDMIWSVDAEGRYTFVNAAVKRIYGYEPEEMLGRPFMDFAPHEQNANDLKVFQRLRHGESIFQYETTHLAKDGRPIQLMFNAIALRDENGNFIGTTGTASDITERKQREEALRLIVEGTASSTGTSFMRSCVRYLAQVLQVRYALIAEVTDEMQTVARTLAFWMGETWGKNFEYEIEHTPCKHILNGTPCHYPENVQGLFPNDPYLVQLNAESYLGIPLIDSVGNVLGILAVLDVKPIARESGQESILKIFAARASAELERQQIEEALRESAKREHAIARVMQRMRQTLDIETIFRATTEELRLLLECDRVAIYQFNPDWSGEFVSESVASGWISLITKQNNDPYLQGGFLSDENCAIEPLNLKINPVQDTYLQETQGGAYSQGVNYLYVEDIYKAEFNECYINLLEQFQARAYITVPIFCGTQLWGLLASYQNSSPRQWKAAEINIVVQIGTQLGVALQQVQLLEETQRQATQLGEAKVAAEIANLAKSQFLANMSHELRTPLNAILGFTQVLNRDASLSYEQHEHLGIIMRSGEHLLDLINDILEMSKIEAGRTALHESSFDLYGLLDTLQEMLQIKAHSKGLLLIFERSPDVPQYVIADEGKLRQVLINLLGNAVKFTQQGRVTLRVRVGDGDTNGTGENFSNSQFPIPYSRLYFEVSDTGLGIAPEEINSLFERFTQTETGRNSSEGTGLGLTISRSFVQLMGGNITVSSTLGQGATFRFDIQYTLAQGSDMQMAQATGRVIGLASEEGEYRILVVEDKWTNRLLLVKLLKIVGFQVREAENGKEAIALWLSWKPHLVFMDMQMPVMDGYEATKQIREAEVRRKLALEQQFWQDSSNSVQDEASSRTESRLQTPLQPSDSPLSTTDFTLDRPTVIIALTASAFEEQRTAILSVGCDDFIRKPFREKVLFDAIARHLGVRYLYEVEEQSSISQTPTPLSALTREMFDVMPTEWVQQLYQASLSMDEQQIIELIDQIPQTQATLASTLRNLVDNFRLDIVIDCLDAEPTPTHED